MKYTLDYMKSLSVADRLKVLNTLTDDEADAMINDILVNADEKLLNKAINIMVDIMTKERETTA